MIPVKSGRIAAPIVLTAVRELTHTDIARLASEPIERSVAPILQRLRAPHHAAARLIAAGKSYTEVAVIVGRTPQRIGDLMKDKLFRELVAYYADQIETADIQDASRLGRKLNIIAETSADEIIDRLEDDVSRSKIPMSELRQLTEMAADRTTNPPKTAVPLTGVPANITFNIGGALERPVQAVIEHKGGDDGPTGESNADGEAVSTEAPSKGK